MSGDTGADTTAPDISKPGGGGWDNPFKFNSSPAPAPDLKRMPDPGDPEFAPGRKGVDVDTGKEVTTPLVPRAAPLPDPWDPKAKYLEQRGIKRGGRAKKRKR